MHRPSASFFLGCSLLAAAAFVAAGCRTAHAQAGDRTLALQHDGRSRSAIVHVPPGYTPGRPTPLVLLFHGGGGNGAQAERSYAMNAVSDREGFLVVYPNGTSSGLNLLTWNAANCCAYAYEHDVDDVGFVRALLDELEHEYTVDPRRIYATGMSNGGMMTYRLGCQLADRLAAISPVAGSLNEDVCAPVAPLPIIIFHGTADTHVPYDGGYGSASAYEHLDQPVSHAVSFWVARDACSPTPTTVTSPSGNIVADTYGGGVGGAEVVLYTVIGGGHAWPGGSAGSAMGDVPTQEISASELMWAFFARHPKIDETAVGVSVLTPNGGERIRRGRATDVAWNVESSSPLASTEVWLSSDGGATYSTKLSTIADPAARSYRWDVPSTQPKGKAYRVRVVVTTAAGSMAEDASDGNFRIKK
jgi:polyhydroxybutyrate depolymerase